MTKDKQYCYSLCYPSFLTDFIPNLHITPQQILYKKEKNNRFICNCLFLVDESSVSANMMLNTKNEHYITYCTTWYRHLQRIWNMRITYSDEEVLLFHDDVKGSFQHCKYVNDITSTFAYVISNKIYLPLGGIFGFTTSPAKFEPLAHAPAHLTQ